jgi:hypothetical protein
MSSSRDEEVMFDDDNIRKPAIVVGLIDIGGSRTFPLMMD